MCDVQGYVYRLLLRRAVKGGASIFWGSVCVFEELQGVFVGLRGVSCRSGPLRACPVIEKEALVCCGWFWFDLSGLCPWEVKVTQIART